MHTTIYSELRDFGRQLAVIICNVDDGKIVSVAPPLQCIFDKVGPFEHKALRPTLMFIQTPEINEISTKIVDGVIEFVEPIKRFGLDIDFLKKALSGLTHAQRVFAIEYLAQLNAAK